jgi:hypothetical protein
MAPCVTSKNNTTMTEGRNKNTNTVFIYPYRGVFIINYYSEYFQRHGYWGGHSLFPLRYGIPEYSCARNVRPCFLDAFLSNYLSVLVLPSKIKLLDHRSLSDDRIIKNRRFITLSLTIALAFRYAPVRWKKEEERRSPLKSTSSFLFFYSTTRQGDFRCTVAPIHINCKLLTKLGSA